jgi:spore cortex formation protein SpoVR/YcgB (stage V sporulation)
MNQAEMEDLQQSIDKMMEIAQGFGLDFYPMRFEVCPADIIYTFGAYGMPTRYSHWSFGKANTQTHEAYAVALGHEARMRRQDTSAEQGCRCHIGGNYFEDKK